MTDTPNYQKKKAFFNSLLTIYGRKPVLEALQDPQVSVYKLHLADSNKGGGIISEILQLAEQRNIEISWHDKKALSRISKNSKQDQGVAADLQLPHYQPLNDFLDEMGERHFRLIALDGITNPQNLGMIIRSVCAGNVDGLILPRKGCAALSPLVIKASVGTLFKTRILRCEDLLEGLKSLQPLATICTLSSHASMSLFEYEPSQSVIYILGNESEGVSREIDNLADTALCIPMNNGVESLNVAITAALVAFKT